jgi:hypothetical protein
MPAIISGAFGTSILGVLDKNPLKYFFEIFTSRAQETTANVPAKKI